MTIHTTLTESTARLDTTGAYLLMGVESEITGVDEDGREESEDTVLITMIETAAAYRGRGLARKLLRAAIETATRQWPDLPLRLAVVPQDSDTDMERLVAFYESEGFTLMQADEAVVMEY